MILGAEKQYYRYEVASKISKWNHRDKREIKPRTCSKSHFLQSREFHKCFWGDIVQIKIKTLPAQTTFCSYTEKLPKDQGKFKFRGKEGVDCFTGYNVGSRDFSPNYSQTRSLRQLWSNSKWSFIYCTFPPVHGTLYTVHDEQRRKNGKWKVSVAKSWRINVYHNKFFKFLFFFLWKSMVTFWTELLKCLTCSLKRREPYEAKRKKKKKPLIFVIMDLFTLMTFMDLFYFNDKCRVFPEGLDTV